MTYNPRAIQARKRTARMAVARAKGRHTKQEWADLKYFFRFRCVRCGKREQWPDVLQKDHVYEVALGGCDCIANIQPLCSSCNAQKNGRHGESWDFRQAAKERMGLDA